MTRIAFVSTMAVARWGGSEVLWSRTASNLLGRGIDVSASVTQWPEPAKQLVDLEQAGCRMFWREQPTPAPLITRIGRRIGKALAGAGTDAIRQWHEAAKPDLVVVSQGSLSESTEWMQFCREAGTPYAIIVQAVNEFQWPYDHEAEQQGQCFEAARGVYFVSEANLKLARAQFATPLKNASVVRNPFNVRWDANPAWPSDETTKLACVGELHPARKGQDILMEVMSAPKWLGRPLTVSLFGDGPSRQRLVDLKELYGATNVEFCGFSTDIESVWSSHHALVLPSRMEGLPLVAVEAMLCGRPCIVSDVAGNAELIDDNVTGFVAAAANAKQMDEALERAWNRRTEWQSIGRQASVKVRELVPRDPVAAFADLLLQEHLASAP